MDQTSESNGNHTRSYNVEDGRTKNGWDTFKREEWYKAALSNIYTTSTEFDKTLILFNGVIIGFIINLMAGIDKTESDIFNFIFYGIGIVSMIVSAISIYALTQVFRINPEYLKARLYGTKDEEGKLNNELNDYDSLARRCFIWAVVFVILFAIFMIMGKISFGLGDK